MRLAEYVVSMAWIAPSEPAKAGMAAKGLSIATGSEVVEVESPGGPALAQGALAPPLPAPLRPGCLLKRSPWLWQIPHLPSLAMMWKLYAQFPQRVHHVNGCFRGMAQLHGTLVP